MHPQRRPDEQFGVRLGFLRVEAGLTQQRLAERIAMSRAGVSHLEAGLSTPSERTVTLLAGVFGLDPHQLVAGTDYPIARAERLPMTTAIHTRVDLALALFECDMQWCTRLNDPAITAATRQAWRHRLGDLARDTLDHVELERIDRAKQSLRFAHGAGS